MENIAKGYRQKAWVSPAEERPILEEYPYKADFFGNRIWVWELETLEKINLWVISTFGDQNDTWMYYHNTWYFKYPEDLVWFTLKWK